MAIKTASTALVEALQAEGVRYVFGLPGGHSVAIFYDDLARQQQVQAILARHETAGAFAALGYAQVTREAGVCQGTAGPGFSHMLVGLHEAYNARLPLVCIAPNAPIRNHGKGELQEWHQVEQVTNFVKWWYRVDRPEKIPWVMQQAFKHALAPPCGPVFVDIPLDIGGMSAEMPDYRPAPRSRCQADPQEVERAAEMLLSAQRPVMICGRGVHQSGAYAEVRQLAELLAMPVLTTNHGKTSLPESHPLAGGGVGCNRTCGSQRLLEEADCWLWVGSQIEEFAVGKDWPDQTGCRKVINLNVDAGQFGRNYYPDACLLGDAALTLTQLAEVCADRAGARDYATSEAAQRVAAGHAAHRRWVDQIIARTKGPVHHAQFLRELGRQLPGDAVGVIGEGANRVWTATELHLDTPGHWVSASDFGCMGYAVAAAIGASLGKPGHQVVALTGDGSFQMQMQEIVVAAQYKLPITYVVFNNNCLGWIKWGQKVGRDERFYCVDYDVNWKHADAARAAGLQASLVESPEQSAPAIEAALKANAEGQPALIEVMVPWDEPSPGFCEHHDICSMTQAMGDEEEDRA
jgi:acetolactate synthase-1/2/3 large subunit